MWRMRKTMEMCRRQMGMRRRNGFLSCNNSSGISGSFGHQPLKWQETLTQTPRGNREIALGIKRCYGVSMRASDRPKTLRRTSYPKQELFLASAKHLCHFRDRFNSAASKRLPQGDNMLGSCVRSNVYRGRGAQKTQDEYRDMWSNLCNAVRDIRIKASQHEK